MALWVKGGPQAQRAEDRPLLSGTARGLGAGVPRPASVWRDVVCSAFISDWSVSLQLTVSFWLVLSMWLGLLLTHFYLSWDFFFFAAFFLLLFFLTVEYYFSMLSTLCGF